MIERDFEALAMIETDLEAIVTENRSYEGDLTLVVADMYMEEVLYYRTGNDTGTKLKEDLQAFAKNPESWAEWDGNQLDGIKESVQADSKYSKIQDPVLLERAWAEALSEQLHGYVYGDKDGERRVVARANKAGEITMWTGKMGNAAMEALLDMPKTRGAEYCAAVTEDNAGRLYFAVAQYDDQIKYIGTNYEERGSALKEDLQAFIKDPNCWKEWNNDNAVNEIKGAVWKDIEGLKEAVSLPEYERREMFYEKMSAYVQGGMDGELNGLKVVAEINTGGAYTLKIREMGLSAKKALLDYSNTQVIADDLPSHKADTGGMDKFTEARDIAKDQLGDGAIVTSAIPGRTYSGKIFGIVGNGPDKTAIQAISDDHAILHTISEFSASNIRIGEDVSLTADEQGYSAVQGKGPETQAKKNELSREGIKR